MTEAVLDGRRSRAAEHVVMSQAIRQASKGEFALRRMKALSSTSSESDAWPQGQVHLTTSRAKSEHASPLLKFSQLLPDRNEAEFVICSEKHEIATDLRLYLSVARRLLKQEQTLTDTRLEESLQDLHEARDEAREEGFLEPSDMAIATAERLLKAMYEIYPQRFEVYPTPDAEIAIDVPGRYGESVLLLCESSGGALCMVDVNGEHRRARYESTRTLPDGFVTEALRELAHVASRPR